MELPFRQYSCRPDAKYVKHPSFGYTLWDVHPYSDFIHFYWSFKPWEKLKLPRMVQRKEDAVSAKEYWFYELQQLDRELGMGLDFVNWHIETFKKRPLGDR